MYARDAVGVRLGLRRDEGSDVFVQVMLVATEGIAGLRYGGEGCGVGEDLVQVRDGVVVGWRETLVLFVRWCFLEGRYQSPGRAARWQA